MFAKLQEELTTIQSINLACAKDNDLTPQEHEDYREPLSYDVTKKVRVLLSWGGPSDGFDVYFTPENEPLRAVYFWQEWGTHDEIELNSDELDQIIDFYFYGDPSSFFQS